MKLLSRELKLGIKEIPGDEGFSSTRAELLFLDSAVRLLRLGLNEEEVLDFLTNLYSVTAEELGA